MSDLILKVENISKAYRIGLKEKRHDTLGAAMASWVKSPFKNFKKLKSLSNFNNHDDADIFWALKGINFEVKKGEVLGIIGKNGAGKSTLLKILSRITEPTSGRIDIYGRVASLLEVGTGFNQELTGRENVYLNGTILGMKKKEIDCKFDEIVEFSGISKYLDTPVKRYSSGMKVRLAFSVAAHLEPDVLIIDEVLAVGDAEFQAKCLGKMENVAGQGRTILFVSHDLGAVQTLCPTAILLDRGRMVQHDKSQAVINTYLHGLQDRGKTTEALNRFGEGNIQIQSINILSEGFQPLQDVLTGQSFYLQINYKSKFKDRLPSFTYFHIFFKNHLGTSMFILSSKYSASMPKVMEGEGKILCFVKSLPLLPGNYYLDVCCKLSNDTEDYIYDAKTLSVISGMYPGYSRLPSNSAGYFLVEHSWSSE